jgi:NAD(P)-dependent dehydrogenase (short-subunit alcohol dehydrogenase family)
VTVSRAWRERPALGLRVHRRAPAPVEKGAPVAHGVHPGAEAVAGHGVDAVVLHGGVDLDQPQDRLGGQRRVVVGGEDDVLAGVAGQIAQAQALDVALRAGRQPAVVGLSDAQQPGVDADRVAVAGAGRATAHTLAGTGWQVAVLDLDEASAQEAAHEIADRHGIQAVGVGCDITDETSVDNALAALDGTLPPVGALVNNAGITSPTPFLEVSGEEWDRIFAVNVRGAFNVTRRLAPGMAERGFGRIVFLSSVSAERGGGVFGGVAYSAAKAAELGFTRALARELGPHGVTVNAVAPGLIDTDITGGALEGERKTALIAGVPVGRNGRVSDVADLITYLCREESGYITGATYDVNGGSHIH